jgi:hypothetical protein
VQVVGGCWLTFLGRTCEVVSFSVRFFPVSLTTSHFCVFHQICCPKALNVSVVAVNDVGNSSAVLFEFSTLPAPPAAVTTIEVRLSSVCKCRTHRHWLAYHRFGYVGKFAESLLSIIDVIISESDCNVV